MIEPVIPALEDMWFREKLMADEETMSYNHAWGGTIPFPKENWKSWYDYWIVGHEDQRYYRYLKDENGFVGEIAYHFDPEYDGYVADVIIFSEFRGKGYGAEGLRLLCAVAKENGITALYDDIAIDNTAIKLFLKQGFYESYRTEDKIILKKDLLTVHPIPPFFDRGSQILILGSFPSVKSREQMFFYGHPQNRFWKVIAAVFDDAEPVSIPDKKDFLARHHIAMWDVIGSCSIEGSSDASIKNVTANDLSVILDHADIARIFVNGKTAEKYYKKFIKPETGRDAVCLPSTSPANAAWDLKKLVAAWKKEIIPSVAF